MAEQYVSLAEVRDLLTQENEKRGELNSIQGSAMQHAQTTCKISVDQAKALVAELEQNFDFITDPIAFKIADLLPKYSGDVHAIFWKERITLEPDVINKIIETVAKYQ
jgi:DNA-directed RNA polymerase subunit F